MFSKTSFSLLHQKMHSIRLKNKKKHREQRHGEIYNSISNVHGKYISILSGCKSSNLLARIYLYTTGCV